MTDIDSSLLADYIVEALDHLTEMEDLLLHVQDETDQIAAFNGVFRVIHSLKGGAQYLGLQRISSLTHVMEDLLDRLREEKLAFSSQILSLLVEGHDRLSSLIDELNRNEEESTEIDLLVFMLKELLELGDSSAAEMPSAEPLIDPPVQSEFSIVVPNFLPQDEQACDDAELFAIFKQNLLDNFLKLQALYEQWSESADPLNPLEYVEHIRASSNYMGFDDLVGFADAWIHLLKDVEQHPSLNSEQVMGCWLDKIHQVYPDIAVGVSHLAVPDDMDEEEEDIHDLLSTDDDNIDFDLLPDFLVEANESLQDAEDSLLQLSSDLHNEGLLAAVFRSIHTIKGGAQLIGLHRTSALSHRMEDLLGLIRAGKRDFTADDCQLFFQVCDSLKSILLALETSANEQFDVLDLVQSLTMRIEGKPIESVDMGLDNDSLPIDSTLTLEAPIAPSNLEFQGGDDESNDKELYDIFFTHLTTHISWIQQQMDQSEAKIAPTVVHDMQQKLEMLLSSARYMGYESLTTFYAEWLADLAQTGAILKADMLLRIEPLLSTFPKLVLLDTQVDESEDLERIFVPEEPVIEPSTRVKPLEVASVIAPSVPVQDELGDELDALLNHIDLDDNDGLLDELSDALNTTHVPTNMDSLVTLHKVYDEIVSPDKVLASPSPVASPILEPSNPITPTLDKGKEQTASNKSWREKKKVAKKSIRIDADKIDLLMNQVGELVVDRSYFFQLYNDMRDLQSYLKDVAGVNSTDLKKVRGFLSKLSDAISSLSRTSNDLQEGVMKVRMLPVSQLFHRLPRLLYDLTRKNGKNIELIIHGEETELDKMVVEELSDPLIHILRNAVDHGFETPDERLATNKPETGSLVLSASQESNHIIIEIKDDGRGIDTSRIKAKALSRGLYSQEELDRMTERELIWLIMSAGFSTANKVSETSGRGVGMDVVKKNIEKLNGILEIETVFGEGTLIRLKIPLTLAIISALQIRVGEGLFTVPLSNVEETLKVSNQDMSVIQGVKVIHLRGKTLPIFKLSELFNIQSGTQDTNESHFVVVVNTGMHNIGLVVDELREQSEVVIKPLVDYLQDRSGLSGATIIGDGQISLILDIYEIFTMTAESQSKMQAKAEAMNHYVPPSESLFKHYAE